ncbi:hypothetical protein CG478_000970 [Bacillus cytotoxicus]|uniref:hypothetical protein n=1 Tax=Bacillus cytotoxicus TaxID=580165 RepID=UPI000B96E64D|nr:hypothetical protein [Bacillus cytotoxicus]AWC27145.1 hypothetical protein CG483_000970 [Bacillus cytotoxicus]AWC39259.1 hypothetical protein CG480_000970 [Bacillus cytotoxicus]AWC47190.1 hypothetical protein CG478_000970 [Bacillus cytotoxicus]AWC51211.1 hypothetical protein CG477_000970 [Bacillus cytotoxicus]AWC55340.1 hypothetical protein CG476_000970 [Bacillus cytotoxicus]
MFHDVYEIGDVLMVQLKKGVELDSNKVKGAVKKLLSENLIQYAIVSDFLKENRREIIIKLESEFCFEKLMSQGVTLGGRSKKSRMISSEAIVKD